MLRSLHGDSGGSGKHARSAVRDGCARRGGRNAILHRHHADARGRTGSRADRIPHLRRPTEADAGAAIARLHGLGIEVKIITGDNGIVAATVCRQVGVDAGTVLTGAEIDAMDDAGLGARIATDARVRARESGSEVADHQGDAPIRPRRRVSRRRRQRRGRAAPRRCRHLRGLSDGCRQGRCRYRAAREGSRCARRRRRRRPSRLRQHDQVRPDGDVIELRQHVQRRGRLGLSLVPSDAALADPAEQSPVQRRSAGDPDRRSRRTRPLPVRRRGTCGSSGASCSCSVR